jgi:hypothetical protein
VSPENLGNFLSNFLSTVFSLNHGCIHILENPPPPGETSADVILRKKYEKGEEKKEEIVKKRREMTRDQG